MLRKARVYTPSRFSLWQGTSWEFVEIFLTAFFMFVVEMHYPAESNISASCLIDSIGDCFDKK